MVLFVVAFYGFTLLGGGMLIAREAVKAVRTHRALAAQSAVRLAETAALRRRNEICEAFLDEGKRVGRFDDTVAIAAAEHCDASFDEVFTIVDQLRDRVTRRTGRD